MIDVKDFIQQVKMEWYSENIKRENEIETIKDQAYARGWNACQKAIISNINDMAKALEQEPRTGHWKLVQRGKNIDICCSNCEEVRVKSYAYNYTIDQLNKEDLKECFECADMRYCPNCGAKMVEPQESEG